MLRNNEPGFAVMNIELNAISFEHIDLKVCKEYCYGESVIARRIPVVCGFSVKIMWYGWYKPISYRYGIGNFLWLHFSFWKEYLHKTGEIVYRGSEKY